MLTDKLFEFLAAAMPIVAVGLVLAVLAAKHAWMKRNGEKNGDYGAEGMCTGMCAGLCLGTVLGDIGTGLSLGMLIGLAIGSCIKRKGRDKSSDGEEKSRAAEALPADYCRSGLFGAPRRPGGLHRQPC